MFPRLAIATVLACALGSCATYDSGYRQGYADAHRRVAEDANDDGPAFADYDYARNGYYSGYGYPYEVGFGGWQSGFGFGPGFYSPWFGYGYSYVWYRPGHHHHWHDHDHHHATADMVSTRALQSRGAVTNAGAPHGDTRDLPTPFPAGIPMRERGFNDEPRGGRDAPPHHSRR